MLYLFGRLGCDQLSMYIGIYVNTECNIFDVRITLVAFIVFSIEMKKCSKNIFKKYVK